MTYIKDKKWLLDIKYNGQPSWRFQRDILLLKLGFPRDYLIGHTDFLNVQILLHNKPLIPRTETEYWVHKAFSYIEKNIDDTPPSILDMCAGSGCIGVALLKHFPTAKVTFAEVEKRLLPTIRENVSYNHLPEDQVEVLQSDLFASVEGVYDFIFANPPYIDKKKRHTDLNVRLFEPQRALFSKNEGLFHIKQIVTDAYPHMTEGGLLFIEFDFDQCKALRAYLEKVGMYSAYEFWDDQFGRPRVLCLKK